ncbi:MFS transporter [Thermogymnomonas acidicola]|uniref:MFS transporter n=1 Tax=Thermogymnomonas acidicola TaxID=399579 RepID=UPI0009468664|nr:MFS transporter [Thermogymnomonas acidicola]
MRASLRAAAIHTARAVYALNWFDISPALIYISRQLDLSIPQLGLMTTGFYIGLATFQLLGGILASRLGGNRLTATLGISILGLASIVTGLSQDLPRTLRIQVLCGHGLCILLLPPGTGLAL